MVHLFIHFLVMLRQERKQVAFKKKSAGRQEFGYTENLQYIP